MTKNRPPSPEAENPLWMEELDQQIDDLVNSAPHILPKPFEDVCEYIENRSVTFKLFRNEFSLPAFSAKRGKNKIKQLAQEVLQPEENKKRIAAYFVPLPFNRSLFTVQDMNDLFAIYTAGPTTETPTSSQLMTYSNSLNNIQAENNEYLQHIKRRWLEESWTRVNVIKEEVTLFASLWWEARINCVRNYAETYSRLSPVPLTPSDIEGKLVFLKSLRKYGKPTRYYSSSYIKSQYPMSLVHGELLKIERGRAKKRKSAFNDTKKQVSGDKMAESFAVAHDAQMVTTPSVLATVLANTPGTFEESWCIPFIVKDYSSGDQHKKIIFMDKKLPPKTLSVSEKNAIFSKAATRAIFVKSANSLAALDSTDQAQYYHESDEEYEEDKCEDDKYDDDKCGTGEGEKEEEEDDELAYEKKRGLREEISYDLWEYSEAEVHSVLSKNHRKPFKILLKTKTKGKTFDSQKKMLPCVMSAKLEYQPEYGASVMSFKEMMREWISLKLRPDSFLHRVRVDPMKGDTIMVEYKTAAAVSNDCQRLHSRCVRHQLSVIQVLFNHLSPLPPGNYLLSHEPKDKGFMFVYHELQDKQKRTVTNMNIWEDYSQIDTSKHCEQLAPWIPIDPTIMTPTLHQLRRIPCVFPPVKNSANKKVLPEVRRKQKKKKNKKKSGLQQRTRAKKRALEQSTNKEIEEQNQPCPDTSRELVSYDGVFDE